MRAFDASEIAVLIDICVDERCLLVVSHLHAPGSTAARARN
jgi:hypothetical protein